MARSGRVLRSGTVRRDTWPWLLAWLLEDLIPAQLNARLQMFHHPEYSSQIWAPERARILLGPTAPYRLGKTEVKEWCALEVDPSQLIGVNGDAVYLTFGAAGLPAGRPGLRRRRQDRPAAGEGQDRGAV